MSTLPSEILDAVAHGAHHDPHSVLGVHETGDGWVIRARRPLAREVEALLADGSSVELVHVRGGVWDTVPPVRWFEEMLAELVECYYSHPLAQEDIGYVGMADAPGWPALGLDVLDPREPRPLARPFARPLGRGQDGADD